MLIDCFKVKDVKVKYCSERCDESKALLGNVLQ